MTNEEKAKSGELEKTNCRVAKVETVNAKHTKEHGEEEGSVEVISVSPLAGLVPGEGGVAGGVADDAWQSKALLWSLSSSVV